MYVLSVRTQNELAFFRNIVGMDSVEKKEGCPSLRRTAFLSLYKCKGIANYRAPTSFKAAFVP